VSNAPSQTIAARDGTSEGASSRGLLCDVAGSAMIGVVLNVSASAGFEPCDAISRSSVSRPSWPPHRRGPVSFRYRHGVLASWPQGPPGISSTRGATFALPFIVALGFAFLRTPRPPLRRRAFFGPRLVAEHVTGDRTRRMSAPPRRRSPKDSRPRVLAFIGLSVVVKSLADAPLVLSILAVAVLSKFIGGYVGAPLVQFSQRLRAAGIAMNGRGPWSSSSRHRTRARPH